jgi:hypothetical protein
MKKDEEKKLVAFRIPDQWVVTLQELPEIIGFSQQRIMQDALAILFGTRDPLIRKRHMMVLDAIKKGQVKAPFDPTISSCGAEMMALEQMTLCTT